MNRRQLFRTLIYAPLIAPLAGMMPKPKPKMRQETIRFLIDADTKAGTLAVKRMTEELRKIDIEIKGELFNPEKLREKIYQARMEASIKINSHQKD